ncbi:T-complex protein 1 subunit gamma [Tanacetum coccineum]
MSIALKVCKWSLLRNVAKYTHIFVFGGVVDEDVVSEPQVDKVDTFNPKACTVLLRGASKDLLNEVERNLQDAMSVARNILKHPKLVPRGGATELTVSATLKQKSSSWPYEAAAVAFEAIPRTLAQNCGHANGENAWTGIDGNSGEIADMKELKRQAPGSQPSKPTIETGDDADNEQMIPE